MLFVFAKIFHLISFCDKKMLVYVLSLDDVPLTREVAGSNPGKGHWWTTGRTSGPKMLTAPAKSQLTIGHRPSPVKTGSV